MENDHSFCCINGKVRSLRPSLLVAGGKKTPHFPPGCIHSNPNEHAVAVISVAFVQPRGRQKPLSRCKAV